MGHRVLIAIECNALWMLFSVVVASPKPVKIANKSLVSNRLLKGNCYLLLLKLGINWLLYRTVENVIVNHY